MAKFENTFRMRPWEVKQGAQENLKKLGIVFSSVDNHPKVVDPPKKTIFFSQFV